MILNAKSVPFDFSEIFLRFLFVVFSFVSASESETNFRFGWLKFFPSPGVTVDVQHGEIGLDKERGMSPMQADCEGLPFEEEELRELPGDQYPADDVEINTLSLISTAI